MNKVEFYRTSNGETQIEVKFEKEPVRLSLNQIAELFGRGKSMILSHLDNVFKSKGLYRNSVVAKNATTASDGKTKINANALTAIALLIAQSNPNENDLMIKLICNLIK